MTQAEHLRSLFDSNGGRVTLLGLMQSHLGASYRQRIADLRIELAKEGKSIVCHQNREEGHKSETYWEITEMPKRFYTEPTGQTVMIFR